MAIQLPEDQAAGVWGNKMHDGYYVIQFIGVSDIRNGMMVLDTGIVMGGDANGGIIDGTYQINSRTGMIDIDVVWKTTRPVQLIQGQFVDLEFSMPLKTSLPNSLGQQITSQIKTPMESIGFVMTKVREFPNS